MKLLCLAIGKKHDAAIAAAIDDYTKRLQRYTPLDWQILPPAKGKMGVDVALRAESAQLLAQVKADDYIVLLDEDGVELASSELADILDTLDMQVAKRIVFIIGGAYGVTDELKKRADVLWSLSRLTFPHQLVRLLLAEQLYRANTIRRGEPYHHE
jgi:23S rRNA (pseudouridine1915-N3)-methyltransferase